MSDIWKHRQFFLKIAIFITVFLVINQGLNYRYTRWVRQWEHFEVSRLGFESLQDSVSIVFVGDSHTANAVVTPYIPGAYNFGFNGESPIESYYSWICIRFLATDRTASEIRLSGSNILITGNWGGLKAVHTPT